MSESSPERRRRLGSQEQPSLFLKVQSGSEYSILPVLVSSRCQVALLLLLLVKCSNSIRLKMMLIFFLFHFICSARASPALRQKHISIRGYPADLQRAVAAAIASGVPSYTVAPGLYNFSSLPANASVTLDILSATNFTLLSGGEVEFVFPPAGGIRVVNGSQVALAGPFILDAWPPFTTQGVISKGVRDGQWFNFTLSLEEGYDFDERFLPSRAIFFDPVTRRFLPNQVLAVTSARSARHLSGTSWAVSVSFSANPTLSIPDGALCALTPTSDGPVVLIENSTAVSVTDLTSHAASEFTLLELGGEGGHTYTRFNVVRRAGSTRLMVSGADVLHSTSVAVGPTLRNSELSFASDDLFAVHCELAILWKRVSATSFFVIDTSGGFYGFPQAQPGDSLSFYNMSEYMERVGEATLAPSGLSRVTNATLIAEAQKAADHIRDVLKLKIRNFSVNLLLMELSSPGLLKLGDYSALIELPSRCGAGTSIRNSYLHDTNGGMRLKGSRAIVDGVVLEKSYGMRMLPEFFWTQSVSSNITLTNNVLRDCGCTALAPHAIEYNEDIVGLVLHNNTVYPAHCM